MKQISVLYLLLPAVNTPINNSTEESTIPREIPTNETKTKIKCIERLHQQN